MSQKDQHELMHADCLSIQFIGADGEWELPYALPELLTEAAKEIMSHTSLRFVLYGELDTRRLDTPPAQTQLSDDGWKELISSYLSELQKLNTLGLKKSTHRVRRPYSRVFEPCPGCDECNKPSSRIFLSRDLALRLLRKLLGQKPKQNQGYR